MKLDMMFEVTPRTSQFRRDPGPAAALAFQECMEQVVLGDRQGFNCVWIPEHHFYSPELAQCSAPEVIIGALAAATERIRLGFGVTLLPFGFGHPARVAERVATADVISGGRVEWGTGRSIPAEQLAFHVATDDRTKDEVRAATKMIVDMWSQDSWSCDNEYLVMPERVVRPKPYQQPHPPCWLAAGSDDSAILAGKGGLGLLSLTLMRPLEWLASQVALYRDAFRDVEPITRVLNNRVAAFTMVHCREREADAFSPVVAESVAWWWEVIAKTHGQFRSAMKTTSSGNPIDAILERCQALRADPSKLATDESVIVGTPDQVVEKMKRYADAGVDQLMCAMQFGDLPRDAILETIELLGTKVRPELAQIPAAVATPVQAV